MRLASVILVAAALGACEQRAAAPAAPAQTEASASSGMSETATSSVPSSATSSASSAEASAMPGATALGPDGVGPLRVGMTFAQAEAALGAPFTVAEDFGPAATACNFGKSTALPGVLVMVEGGKLVRFDLTDEALTDAKGVKTGDPVAKVEAAYPTGLTSSPHKYLEAPGKYLEWFNADRSRGIRYEIDQQGKVGAIYAGAVPQVEYVEGCA